MSDPMKAIKMRLPQDLLEQLQQTAKRYDLSTAALVRIGVRQLLERECKDPGKSVIQHFDHAKQVASQLERHTNEGLYDVNTPPSNPLGWLGDKR